VTKPFLLEIGVEEVPAHVVKPSAEALRDGLRALLEEARLLAPGAGVTCAGTPRRLVAEASGVLERQEDREVVALGPAKRASFDNSGAPTKAAIGFARSRGLEPAQLEVVATEKGEYVAARVLERGEAADALLAASMPALIGSLRFPKSMRWESTGAVFTRPVRSLLALLGDAPLSFRFADVESGTVTHGHRFLGRGPHRVPSPALYREILRGAHVIVDHDERRESIARALAAAAESIGGRVALDEDLLDEVTFLVETPGVIAGSFDRRYLDLPREVIATAMKAHQRYFTVEDASGRLLPNFLSVVNIPTGAAGDRERDATVRAGNERVLVARLEDAEFYWREDQKTALRDKVPLLDRVVWQEALGTVGEKARRIQTLGESLARGTSASAQEAVRRGALLAKADLVTDMIQDGKEFTKLQGFMGREYARASGEPEEIAEAIFEHYLPRFGGDRLPATPAGTILSVADKIDTITGCFGVGFAPTGSQDPYALRRLARGVLRIFRESDVATDWDLRALVTQSVALYGEKLRVAPDELASDVMSFFEDRLENLLTEAGVSYDAALAALAVTTSPRDAEPRARAIDAFRASADFERLTIGFKRVSNILKGVERVDRLDAARLAEDAERQLHAAVEKAAREIAKPLAAHDYESVMRLLLSLRPAIDAFFDKVLVMTDDATVRANRLALLAEVRSLFLRFADLSRIVIEGEKR
jgi:glycyl-tRNA synthetase beta chain